MTTRFDFALNCPEHDHAGLMRAVEQYADELALSASVRFRLLLLIDEIVSNSLQHGQTPGDPANPGCSAEPVRIAITDHDAGLTIEITDNGPPFDPAAHPAPSYDGQTPPKIGGMGLCLIRKMAASLRYERLDGRNHVRITLTKEPEENRCCSST